MKTRHKSYNADFGLVELESEFPEAYAALPESYTADSCLVFFIDVNGHVCAEDDNGNEYTWINNSTFNGRSTFWAKIG